MDVNNEGFFEPLAQKPVAWMSDEIEDCDGDAVHDFSSYQDNHCKNPLYTTPPQPKEPEQEPVGFAVMQKPWVGLTTDDWDEIKKQVKFNFEMTTGEYAERVSHLVEDKLREKNT